MSNLEDKFFDFYTDYVSYIQHPRKWNKMHRRLFILTLPISWPIYAIINIITLIVLIPIYFTLLTIEKVYNLWTRK